MKRLIPCLFFLLPLALLNAQSLISATFLGHKTKTELQLQYLIFPVKSGVNMYKVSYTTPDVAGNPSVASGLVAIPDDTTKIYPLLCYQHGTSSSKSDVPSNLNQESAIPIMFASLGYMVAAPDYLGLGDSPGFHPYVHAATEASAGADALQAVKDFALQEGLCHDNRVFLTGYSQGGHASAALHRLLEPLDEYSVVAGAHLSGPYSISEVMRDLLFADEPYSRPAYLINTMFSYQYVYGNLYSDMTEAVKPAYVDKCNQYYNGEINLAQLNDFLITTLTANEGSAIPSRIFNDDFKAAIEADANHPVNLALADNDVIDWIPSSLTRLFYCSGDDQVPFENSLVAEEAFLANGALNLDAQDLGANLDHIGCVTPALINTVLNVFSPLQGTLAACNPVSATTVPQLEFDIYPNPTSDAFFLRGFPSNGQLSILDVQGRVVYQQMVGIGDSELSTLQFANGMYFLEVQTESGNFRSKLVVAH